MCVLHALSLKSEKPCFISLWLGIMNVLLASTADVGPVRREDKLPSERQKDPTAQCSLGLTLPTILGALRSPPRYAQAKFKFAKFGVKQSELILAKATVKHFIETNWTIYIYY